MTPDAKADGRPIQDTWGSSDLPSALRKPALGALSTGPLDLLVIGGGIVGAGIARDAAMRGLRVGLVEQHDFAFGTSSRSSRLLHGGLRYLAQGRIGLVREASIEKTILHRIAPHLSDPLPFLFPTYRHNRRWPLWQLRIGVKLYDLLCAGRNLGKSTSLDSRALLEKVPILNPIGLTGAVRYYDGLTNDARLTLDTLRSAARHGAHLLNYCRFENAFRARLWRCRLKDLFGGGEFSLEARAMVNATGPWAATLPHSQVKLHLTKGVHLVVEHARLPIPETVVMTEDKRILFAIPWGERTILGTTDTDYAGPIDDVRPDRGDLAYLLEVTNRHFPEARLQVEDVISCWAGLRPLIADGNRDPSDISRSHLIRTPEPGWWDVTGGKLTTYRLMAQQTVDRVIAFLRRQGIGKTVHPCRTATEPLLPPGEAQALSGVLPPAMNRGVVEHYIKNEWALHLEDVMVRRTNWQYYLPEAPALASRVADWMGEMLNWSTGCRSAELERYQEAVAWPAKIDRRNSANRPT